MAITNKGLYNICLEKESLKKLMTKTSLYKTYLQNKVNFNL